MQIMFYLPIYFQSIRGQTAIVRGVNTLPYVAFFALASVVSGYLVGRTRVLMPLELASGLLATAGTALLYTMGADAPVARYVGPQLLVGSGIGLGNQVPMMAVQSFAAAEDMASVTGVMLIMCPDWQ